MSRIVSRSSALSDFCFVLPLARVDDVLALADDRLSWSVDRSPRQLLLRRPAVVVDGLLSSFSRNLSINSFVGIRSKGGTFVSSTGAICNGTDARSNECTRCLRSVNVFVQRNIAGQRNTLAPIAFLSALPQHIVPTIFLQAPVS